MEHECGGAGHKLCSQVKRNKNQLFLVPDSAEIHFEEPVEKTCIGREREEDLDTGKNQENPTGQFQDIECNPVPASRNQMLKNQGILNIAPVEYFMKRKPAMCLNVICLNGFNGFGQFHSGLISHIAEKYRRGMLVGQMTLIIKRFGLALEVEDIATKAQSSFPETAFFKTGKSCYKQVAEAHGMHGSGNEGIASFGIVCLKEDRCV